MMICPHCSHQMADAPELAGQFVACPRCRKQFPIPPSSTIPPPPAASQPYAAPFDEFAIDTRGSRGGQGNRTSLSSRVSSEYRRAKKSATKLPKFFLLAATMIWPIAAAGWGQVRYSWSMAEGKEIDGGDAFQLFIDSGMRRIDKNIFELRADHARWTGMKHVTIIYAVAAIGCLAWWFYVKD